LGKISGIERNEGSGDSNNAVHKVPISWPIRCTVIFSFEILEKTNDDCILIVIYWKITVCYISKLATII
jgi:hypothetical protein